jgi:GNAT superfamily N-acetyltransferase
MLETYEDLEEKLPYSWPRSVLEKLRPLKISVCPPHRLPDCEALYELNIPHGLPPDELGVYSKTLRDGHHLVLIAEEGETLVGTFAMARLQDRPIFWLVYLLVHPEHHRKGIGTTMMLASLGLLPQPSGNEIQVVALTTLPHAISFYELFGFYRWSDERKPERTIPIFTLPVLQELNTRCQDWLAQAGTRLDALGSLIPMGE